MHSSRKVIYTPGLEHKKVEKVNTYERMMVKGKYKKWLADKVFEYLMKIGYIRKSMEVKEEFKALKTEIDLDKLRELIFETEEAIYNICNKQSNTLICGRDVMHKIMSKPIYSRIDLKVPVEWNTFTTNPHTMEHERKVTFMGLNVILVPWFEGILILPEGTNV